MKYLFIGWICVFLLAEKLVGQPRALVFQSDFGLKDGAVAAMKGVAFSVSPDLKIFDITHEIESYNISEAAHRLNQTASYWPAGTVFVSIVDPGVGSDRTSIVLKTKSGHYFVTPDNGTVTLIAKNLGVEEVRQIDEAVNRLKNSTQSYTFHGRDVYAYTGARLASGAISFQQVGPVLKKELVLLPLAQPKVTRGLIEGQITVLDVQYGNVWTNIESSQLDEVGIRLRDIVRIKILVEGKIVYDARVPFVRTFADVPTGNELAYMNSLLQFSIAVNQGNFAEKHKVEAGDKWLVVLSKE